LSINTIERKPGSADIKAALPGFFCKSEFNR